MSLLTAYEVKGASLVPVADPDSDPRGLLFPWEQPRRDALYYLGVDPTVGIPGWTRHLRTQDDYRIDNAAIEVVRKGERGQPDVQVAEYAAPVDSFDLAPVVNLLGRLYCGRAEDAQAMVIIEVYPGPGLTTQRELMSHFGYLNLFSQRYLDTLVPQQRRTSPFGWTATKQSVRDLWVKGMHHISGRRVTLHSPALIEEMSDCEADMATMAMKAIFGRHDDRVRALLLALWAAQDWGDVNVAPTVYEPEVREKGSWQARPVSAARMAVEWRDRFDQLLEED